MIVVIIVAGASFYGGMEFQKSQIKNFKVGAGDRMQQFQQGGPNASGMGAGKNNGGGFIMGDIISKDDKSITLKDRNGGSKIIFFSETTEISKFAQGSAGDLVVGQSVTVVGKTNSDGSVIAQTIQQRPNMPTQQAVQQ